MVVNHDRRSRVARVGLAWALLGCPALAQVGQFAPPAAPPYTLDNVQGEWVNYETQLIKPILVTTNKLVVVANEPNGTLDFFDLDLNYKTSLVLGHGICSIAERPRTVSDTDPDDPNDPAGDADKAAPPVELWVTVRHQQAIAIVDASRIVVTDWIRPPISALGIGYGDADHPGQVVFSDLSINKAYVTCFNTDRVAVFRASTRAFLGVINLQRTHNGMASALNTPYSMQVVGKELYVVSQISGNQTIPESSATFVGQKPPDGFVIRDLNADPNRSLPDFDIITVDTVTDTVVNHKSGVGSINFNISYHKRTDQLVVSNVELRNGAFIGEGSWPNGQVGFNRLTYIKRAGTPAGPHTIINTESLGSPTNHVAQPTDLLVDHFDRVVVAGYGSSQVGFFDGAGVYLGGIRTPPGPRGVALGANRRLYVLCRGDDRVLWYDLTTAAIPAVAGGSANLVDPTPENIKQGRKEFISSANSGLQTTSCNTCHVDGRKGGVGWDLSKYHDSGTMFTLTAPPTFWQDRKGVFVTQDLRSLPEVAPYHWRGEQHDLEFFNGAFEGLLHGKKLTDDAFADFKAFVFSMRYTANGEQLLNRDFTANATTALTTDNCFICHGLPLGTDNDITIPITNNFALLTPLTAQLRALREKESARCNIDNTGGTSLRNMTGFGLLHNGLNLDSDEFIDFFFAGLATRKAMLNEFDTGLAPSAMYSEILNSATAGSIQMAYMTDQANRGFCDLAARGRRLMGLVWQNVGMLWDPVTATFRFDDSTMAPITSATALALASAGQLDVVMICTPVWSGERVGLDLDRDGLFDRDEVVAGLDPTNPDSDGDGLWESYDPNPSVPSAPPGGSVTAFNIQVGLITTNTVKVTWETDTFSPTRLIYGLTTGYGSSDGDPFPISLAPNTSRLWKRKHTAFLRVLQDGALYNFAIVTQGQNGVVAQTPNMTVLVNPDVLNPNVRVDSVTLTQVGTAPNINWVATVRVVDNAGVPVVGANVRAQFDHFIGANPASEVFIGPVTTGVGGIANLVSPFVGQAVGDKSRVTIPQLINNGGGTFVLPVSSGPGTFFWPESAPTAAETPVL